MIKILTLNWNGRSKLEKLYPTLISSLDKLKYTWLVKDNASKDEGVEYLKSLNDSNIDIYPYHDNKQNFSEGMNYLFDKSNANDEDYVLLLNNDVMFNDTSSIHNMIDIMEKDDSVGIVGARLLYTNTNKIQHAGVIFHEVNGMPLHFRANEVADKYTEENREFQAVTGAVMLTKAKYYKNICKTNKSGIGGLAETYFWAFDDINACLSVKYSLNKKIIYCGKTNISHEESASLKKNPVNKLYLQQNARLLKTDWGSRYIIDRPIYLQNPNHNLYKFK